MNYLEESYSCCSSDFHTLSIVKIHFSFQLPLFLLPYFLDLLDLDFSGGNWVGGGTIKKHTENLYEFIYNLVRLQLVRFWSRFLWLFEHDHPWRDQRCQISLHSPPEAHEDRLVYSKSICNILHTLVNFVPLTPTYCPKLRKGCSFLGTRDLLTFKGTLEYKSFSHCFSNEKL